MKILLERHGFLKVKKSMFVCLCICLKSCKKRNFLFVSISSHDICSKSN